MLLSNSKPPSYQVEILAKQSEEFSKIESELIILLKQHQTYLKKYIENKT